MIGRLTGTIVDHDARHIILDVHGVGYKIYTTADIITKLSPKESNQVTLWTHTAVREDALDLYGFLSKAELEFFGLLITISGIGPKTALGILNVASVHTLETAIHTGDTSHLIKVSGIGKKLAEKIVRELENKISTANVSLPHDAQSEADALEALKALGYSPHEARSALKKIDPSIQDIGEKVKATLKLLGK